MRLECTHLRLGFPTRYSHDGEEIGSAWSEAGLAFSQRSDGGIRRTRLHKRCVAVPWMALCVAEVMQFPPSHPLHQHHAVLVLCKGTQQRELHIYGREEALKFHRRIDRPA